MGPSGNPGPPGLRGKDVSKPWKKCVCVLVCGSFLAAVHI